MAYDISIEKLPRNAIIELQGERDDIADWVGDELPPFPEQPNTGSMRDGLALYWVAPQRWLLRAAIEREESLLAATRPASAPLDISVVLLSDSMQFFGIRGRDAADIIAIASPLDCHESVFPQNGAAYTDIFGIRGWLLRCADGFEIAVESSYADMIADYLQRANA